MLAQCLQMYPQDELRRLQGPMRLLEGEKAWRVGILSDSSTLDQVSGLLCAALAKREDTTDCTSPFYILPLDDQDFDGDKMQTCYSNCNCFVHKLASWWPECMRKQTNNFGCENSPLSESTFCAEA